MADLDPRDEKVLHLLLEKELLTRGQEQRVRSAMGRGMSLPDAVARTPLVEPVKFASIQAMVGSQQRELRPQEPGPAGESTVQSFDSLMEPARPLRNFVPITADDADVALEIDDDELPETVNLGGEEFRLENHGPVKSGGDDSPACLVVQRLDDLEVALDLDDESTRPVDAELSVEDDETLPPPGMGRPAVMAAPPVPPAPEPPPAPPAAEPTPAPSVLMELDEDLILDHEEYLDEVAETSGSAHAEEPVRLSTLPSTVDASGDEEEPVRLSEMPTTVGMELDEDLILDHGEFLQELDSELELPDDLELELPDVPAAAPTDRRMDSLDELDADLELSYDDAAAAAPSSIRQHHGPGHLHEEVGNALEDIFEVGGDDSTAATAAPPPLPAIQVKPRGRTEDYLPRKGSVPSFDLKDDEGIPLIGEVNDFLREAVEQQCLAVEFTIGLNGSSQRFFDSNGNLVEQHELSVEKTQRLTNRIKVMGRIEPWRRGASQRGKCLLRLSGTVHGMLIDLENKTGGQETMTIYLHKE